MASVAISVTIPEWMANKLKKSANKSEVVAEALARHFKDKEEKKNKSTNIRDIARFTNEIVRRTNPTPLTVEEIIELKNRGRRF